MNTTKNKNNTSEIIKSIKRKIGYLCKLLGTIEYRIVEHEEKVINKDSMSILQKKTIISETDNKILLKKLDIMIADIDEYRHVYNGVDNYLEELINAKPYDKNTVWVEVELDDMRLSDTYLDEYFESHIVQYIVLKGLGLPSIEMLQADNISVIRDMFYYVFSNEEKEYIHNYLIKKLGIPDNFRNQTITL